MLLSVTNPDLPTASPSTGKGGVLFRLYKNEDRHLAPLYRYDRFAAYLPGTVEGIAIPIESPDYGGYFYVAPAPLRLSEIISADRFSILRQGATGGLLGMMWHDETRIAFVVNPSFSVIAGQNIEISAKILRSTSNGVITVEPGFTASQVEILGLIFERVESNAGAGQFAQSGTVLTLGSTNNLPLTALATITGSFALTVPQPSGVALGFDLHDSGLATLDGIDYLGMSYEQNVDFFAPKVGGFVFSNPMLTIFASTATAANLIGVRGTSGIASSGSISFEGVA